MQVYRIEISGVVQGVGFRPFLKRLADAQNLRGYCRNHVRGVHVMLGASKNQVDIFVARIKKDAPPLAHVHAVQVFAQEQEISDGFFILPSEKKNSLQTYISADAAICARCRHELLDPQNRRYKYPFINCVDCGARFTIVQNIPYDRAQTSMKHFSLCPTCKTEYNNIDDVRFHAQANACADCGPNIFLHSREGKKIADGKEAIRFAAERILAGGILAIKGVGGYHLACLADDEEAVQELRRRKKREQKPLAVMFTSLQQAGAYAEISAAEENLLLSTAAPIVLCRKKVGGEKKLPPSISLQSNEIGIFLPYSGLHVLLLENCGRPVVMTSANFSGEPMLKDEQEAEFLLKDVADVFLHHNRNIVSRCDDSVVRVFEKKKYFIRRSRGYAPLPFFTKNNFIKNILAVGGDEKNTFALGREQEIILSHHLGDIQNSAAQKVFGESLAHYAQLFEFREEAIVSDLHPRYVSTAMAKEISRQKKISHIQVQHHHAHIVSCLAENEIEQAVIGFAFDGSGFGLDASIWGGEILLADKRDFLRIGFFSPFHLAGGEAAIHHPWKIAYSLLRQAGISHTEIESNIQKNKIFVSPNNSIKEKIFLLQQIFDKKLNSPLTSSLGRLFDGVAALCGLELQNSSSGEAAIALENCLHQATQLSGKVYNIDLNVISSRPRQLELNWLGMIREIWSDVLRGESAAQISFSFHAGLVKALLAAGEKLSADYNIKIFALSGGVFLNRFLLQNLVAGLREKKYSVCTHSQVPCSDGGLSLGQLYIADSLLKGESSCVWQFR